MQKPDKRTVSNKSGNDTDEKRGKKRNVIKTDVKKSETDHNRNEPEKKERRPASKIGAGVKQDVQSRKRTSVAPLTSDFGIRKRKPGTESVGPSVSAVRSSSATGSSTKKNKQIANVRAEQERSSPRTSKDQRVSKGQAHRLDSGQSSSSSSSSSGDKTNDPSGEERGNDSGDKEDSAKNSAAGTESSKKPRESNRVVVVNDEQMYSYTPNSISFCKYSLFTFIPLFLKDQFSIYTNWFFLSIIFIQQLPGISPIGRFTTFLPFSIVMTVTGLKEVKEDIARFQYTRQVNHRRIKVLHGNRFSEIFWKDIRVGDIIKVERNDHMPADAVLLVCSDKNGLCYIQTTSLDGESNLKVRNCLPQFRNLTVPNGVGSLTGTIICDPPNGLIHSFNGVFRHSNGQQYVLDNEQVLLRETVLKNTEWAVGVVVYTGTDTKIMKNSRKSVAKMSTLLYALNKQIIVFVTILLVMVLICSVSSLLWNMQAKRYYWYASVADYNFITNMLSFVVLFSFIIPISLQFIQEVVRYVQVTYINNDEKMYYASSDTWANVKTSNLNEDLGMVQYVFSDKTGTLTQNVLLFKACVIRGEVYSEKNLLRLREMMSAATVKVANNFHHFFISICLCNNVVPVVHDVNTAKVTYFGASPDEAVLIEAAKTFGYQLYRRSGHEVWVRVFDVELHFEVLLFNEFTSSRRCSSVIVKQTSTGDVFIYMMGADDAMRLKVVGKERLIEQTYNHVKGFAVLGLRTLCMGMSKLNAQKTERLISNCTGLLSTDKERKLQTQSWLQNKLEQNVKLLGATAVEDKLQDEVPETIASLLDAGISIWMLTGDKLETAINIGYSTNFLRQSVHTVIMEGDDSDQLRQTIELYSRSLGENLGKPINNVALVITGRALHTVFSNQLQHKFILFAMSCKSVICCRCAPMQKSMIVSYVHHYTQAVTLAIGDGANDVAMIQEANIGVGISGLEGNQAAESADYSIGQFKYLKRLLLVYGTWSYYRIGSLILFCFYKNFLLVCVALYYTAFSGWSGQIVFDEWALMFFNVFLTSSHMFVLGIFEEPFEEEVLTIWPQLYSLNRWFTMSVFLLSLINGAFHGFLIIYLCFRVMESNVFWEEGYSDTYLVQGNTVYTIMVLVICVKFVIHSKHFRWSTALSVIFSVVCWLLLLSILSFIYPKLAVGENMVYMLVMMVKSPMLLLSIFVITITVNILDITIVTYYKISYNPLDDAKRRLHLINT